MLWEGLRIYSRSQYSAVPADCRFILTENVRKALHPDIPERYIGRSILIIRTVNLEELEVEGINFLVVDAPVPEFLIMSQREAERQYPAEMASVRNSGSSAIAKEFQAEQDAMIKIASGKKAAVRNTSKTPVKRAVSKKTTKKKTPEEEEPVVEAEPKKVEPVVEVEPEKDGKPAKLPSKRTTKKSAPKTEPKPVINIPDEEPESGAAKPTPKKSAPKKKAASSANKTDSSAKKAPSGNFKKKAAHTSGSVLLPLWKHKK